MSLVPVAVLAAATRPCCRLQHAGPPAFMLAWSGGAAQELAMRVSAEGRDCRCGVLRAGYRTGTGTMVSIIASPACALPSAPIATNRRLMPPHGWPSAFDQGRLLGLLGGRADGPRCRRAGLVVGNP